MKLKYIIAIVIVLLTTVFGYQSYWLIHLYHTQKAEFNQRMADAIEYSDFQELISRGEYVKYNLNATTTVKVNINNTPKPHKGKTSYAYALNPASLKDPSKTFYNLIRGKLHSVLDPMRRNNIKRFYQLLSKRLSRYGTEVPMRIELRSGKGRLIASYSKDRFKPKVSDTHFDYHFGDGQGSFYRIITPSVTKVIIEEMSGILTASLLIFFLLAFVFVYLIHTVRNLRTLDEMKSDFTNNMTHELKTPIAVAYAANDALLNFDMTRDKTKVEKYLSISLQQLRQLSGLVEQILSMSMERRKNMKLAIEDINVFSLIRPLIAEHKLKSDKPVEISCRIPEDLSIRADRNHFAHIMSNLLDNAIKYSTGKADIVIVAHQKKGFTEISVADHGIGIASDQLKYIFDKFYRVPHGNLHEVKGYGLGLYYVKNMMSRLHGTVDVESELGKGTTFRLRFYD